MTKFFLYLVKLRQLSTRTQRRSDLCGIVEQGVIHFVALSLFRVRDHGLEPVSPEDLLWQITGSGLSGLSCRFYRSLEDRHNLEPLRQHVLGGHVVKRRLRVDFMNDRSGPDEEQVTILTIGAYRQLLLVL